MTSGSVLTNRSVRRMTPVLKLLPRVRCVAVPSVTSTLPPPMSMTDRRAAADVDAVAGGKMDEAGFFRAGNDADPDSCLSHDLGDEVAAIFRFAGGAGGGRDDFVHLVRLGEAPELDQRLQRGGHRRGCEIFSVQATGPEPDHIFFAVYDFEGQVRTDSHHNHVNGVGSDIDGGNTHAGAG